MSILPEGIPALVTVKEASALFRVHHITLHRWVEAGLLRDYSLTRYRMLLSLDELKGMIARKQGRGKMTPRGCAGTNAAKGKANAAKAKA